MESVIAMLSWNEKEGWSDDENFAFARKVREDVVSERLRSHIYVLIALLAVARR